MPWRETLLTTIGPGMFSGITFGDWLRVLLDNRFSIDVPYWGRAAVTTLSSVSNTILRWWENLHYGREIQLAKVDPPLFILGIWRSGTTHLHNLIARDDRFGYPTFYQALHPHTFLHTEGFRARLVQMLLPGTRPLDNVKMGVREPHEDEFALCCLTGRSFLMSLAFPRRTEHHDRYLTFRRAAGSDVAEWKAALMWFVQQLSFKYGRPLVLKSPGHTGRIKMLLELFQERDLVNQIALSNLDDNTMKVIFSSNMTSKPVVEALKKCQEVKFKMGETQRELGLARQQLADIERDQTRIRANLKDRPATAEAYKKYLEKLNAQEGEIDKLTARIKELQEAENQQRKDYEIYLANLSVE